MKASHHNFKTKQQAAEGDETCACFVSFGPGSLRIGLQRVSKPSTTNLKLTKATARPSDPRSTPILNFLVTSCQSLSLSAWLLRLVSEQSKQGQCTVRTKIRTEKKKQIGLRRSPEPAGRNVCKWIVVRVKKQAARCHQIGSFPWWRRQTILKTARLWTPVTLPFLHGSSYKFFCWEVEEFLFSTV